MSPRQSSPNPRFEGTADRRSGSLRTAGAAAPQAERWASQTRHNHTRY